MMEQLRPSRDGWQGLAYEYHLHRGWYEASPWKIPDLEAARRQLQEISGEALGDVCGKILNDLLSVMRSAIEQGVDLYISYK